MQVCDLDEFSQLFVLGKLTVLIKTCTNATDRLIRSLHFCPITPVLAINGSAFSSVITSYMADHLVFFQSSWTLSVEIQVGVAVRVDIGVSIRVGQ